MTLEFDTSVIGHFVKQAGHGKQTTSFTNSGRTARFFCLDVTLSLWLNFDDAIGHDGDRAWMLAA
jgi:hypothetical protein